MKRKSTLREYFESIIVSVVVVLFVRAFVAEAVQVPTGSMEDTLLPGDHLLINKFVFRFYEDREFSPFLPFSPVRRRDVVVFRFVEPKGESRYYVKRVVGLPGELVEIQRKQVHIDGWALDEPYAVFNEPRVKDLRPRDDFGPAEVPRNHFFVLGDNRDRSYDSRFWGFIARRQIVGEPLMIWWSISDETAPVRHASWFARVGGVLLRPFRLTRWDRTGQVVD